jgi:hypothetical protein
VDCRPARRVRPARRAASRSRLTPTAPPGSARTPTRAPARPKTPPGGRHRSDPGCASPLRRPARARRARVDTPCGTPTPDLTRSDQPSPYVTPTSRPHGLMNNLGRAPALARRPRPSERTQTWGTITRRHRVPTPREPKGAGACETVCLAG